MSLVQLAEHLGMKVERRKIPVEELSTFEETGACGTAAVISPFNKIDDIENKQTYQYCEGCKAGPVSLKLYENLIGIQYGNLPDPFGWVNIVE